MPEKMFPTGDSVDSKGRADYTAHEIRRVADALERIEYLLENGYFPFQADPSNLENGISSGTTPAGAEEAMTVSEAAKVLRISLPKMYDLVHQGRVHSVSVGRKILVSRSSLMNMLKEGESQ